MLSVTKEAYQLLNSDALILEYLYSIEYGIKTINSDGSSTFKDVDGNVVEPLRLTGAKIPIMWGIDIYSPATISHSDLSQDGAGAITEATLTVGNADREIQKLISLYNLATKRVWITTLVMERSGGIRDTLQTGMVIKEINVSDKFANFTLSVGLEVLGVSFPSIVARANICRWKFKGTDCKYSGTDTSCTMGWADCLAKSNSRNFGGFPGIINEKFYI